MKNTTEIKYEWVYKPADGIAGELEFESEYGILCFSNGRVFIKIDPNASLWDMSYGDKVGS